MFAAVGREGGDFNSQTASSALRDAPAWESKWVYEEMEYIPIML